MTKPPRCHHDRPTRERMTAQHTDTCPSPTSCDGCVTGEANRLRDQVALVLSEHEYVTFGTCLGCDWQVEDDGSQDVVAYPDQHVLHQADAQLRGVRARTSRSLGPGLRRPRTGRETRTRTPRSSRQVRL